MLIKLNNQFFSHFKYWGDYKNGFYSRDNQSNLQNKCFEFFENENIFKTCQKVKKDWKYSYNINLSNKTINRRAWLGQAGCNYYCGASFLTTIDTWRKLSQFVQYRCNEIADKFVKEYDNEKGNRKECFGRCERTIEMDF